MSGGSICFHAHTDAIEELSHRRAYLLFCTWLQHSHCSATEVHIRPLALSQQNLAFRLAANCSVAAAQLHRSGGGAVLEASRAAESATIAAMRNACTPTRLSARHMRTPAPHLPTFMHIVWVPSACHAAPHAQPQPAPPPHSLPVARHAGSSYCWWPHTRWAATRPAFRPQLIPYLSPNKVQAVPVPAASRYLIMRESSASLSNGLPDCPPRTSSCRHLLILRVSSSASVPDELASSWSASRCAN